MEAVERKVGGVLVFFGDERRRASVMDTAEGPGSVDVVGTFFVDC